jgi:Ser/Thr protein kinase RdoA (MazF antagonist)
VVSGRDLVHLSATIPELAEICQTWGVAVARLHQLSTTRPGVPPAPRPWLLDPDRRARLAGRSGRGSLLAAVAVALDSEPALRSAARAVDARWTDRSWIHGNLTADHVLVQAAPPVRVRFLDFENAGLGDPAWDLATAADTITWLARRRQTPAEPLVDYFFRGYRRSGGHGSLYPAVRAVRALTTAWQLGGSETAPADPQLMRAELQFWLDRARSFAVRALPYRDAA